MKLHNYFRSSASFRVRIALAAKGLSYDYVPVHLVKAEHKNAAYAQKQGDALVPALETDDGHWLSQSMAIIEYLEEQYPESVRMLPADTVGRARVRALAQMIACEIHPINNLRVLKYLVHDLKITEEAKNAWYHHWVREGLEAVERQLALNEAERLASDLTPSVYCYGDTLTLADCCLVPQIFNAQRFKVPYEDLARVNAVLNACMANPAVQQALPSVCPDAEA